MKINTSFQEIIRFTAAGTLVNTTDFSIYYILFHFLPFSLSKALSFTCAGIVGYLLYKRWIFKGGHASLPEEIRYALANSLALAVDVSINHLVLLSFPGAVLMALLIATFATSVFSFFCFKFWVFRIR